MVEEEEIQGKKAPFKRSNTAPEPRLSALAALYNQKEVKKPTSSSLVPARRTPLPKEALKGQVNPWIVQLKSEDAAVGHSVLGAKSA